VLVKDRWINPREQVLNVSIACRRYGPSKSAVDRCLTFFTTSLVESRRETGWGPTYRSASVLRIESGIPFFSRVVTQSDSVDGWQKVAMR
jgi:hypothetical protein